MLRIGEVPNWNIGPETRPIWLAILAFLEAFQTNAAMTLKVNRVAVLTVV